MTSALERVLPLLQPEEVVIVAGSLPPHPKKRVIRTAVLTMSKFKIVFIIY
jgi:hypothetical protein